MEIINTSQPNDFLGDRLRDAFIKINNNFAELLNELDNPITISDINGLANTLNSLQQQINEIQTFDGEPLIYQAGYGISIIGNVISAVGIDLDGYATETYVDDAIDNIEMDYNDLTNKPTIPTNNNQLVNGAGYITLAEVPSGGSVEWDDVLNKPTFFSGAYNDLTGKPTLFDGNYNSLTNRPIIPTNTTQLINGSGFITLLDVPDVYWNDVLNKPTFFSGNYNDLINKPTIPTNNNQLVNGAGYITLAEVPSGGDVEWDDILNKPVLFSGAYNDLTGKPTIPTMTNQLTNNSGFITTSALTGYATQSWVGSQGYLTTVSWNIITDKPVISPVSNNQVSFTDLNIYGTYDNPRTGAITFNLTGAKYGYIQEMYHSGASMPTLPASARIVNDVEYSSSNVNLLLFKYISNSRVEVIINVLEN